jgi:hypothetical protein
MNKAAWHLIMKDKPQRPFNPAFQIKGAATPAPPRMGSPSYPMETAHLRSIAAALANAVNIYAHGPRQRPSLQHRQLRMIRADPSLKVVQSDKNAGLVVMPLAAYHDMVMIHLSSADIYEEIGTIDSTEWRATLLRVRRNHDRLLSAVRIPARDTQLQRFLAAANDRLPTFHCLPKLHKPGRSGRPIIGAVAWLTTNWSIYLDQKLQAHLVRHAIKNSATLVNRLENTAIPRNALFVTADVTSLYTMMDLDRLYAQIRLVTENELLVTILQFICGNNYFRYGNTVRRQRNGIAMGTNCAVQLANLYMAPFDTMFADRVSNYARYIDDIFFIFDGTVAELDKIKQDMNEAIPGIALTFSSSPSSADFLDTTIYRTTENTIAFRLYQKAIATFQYLPPWSCHPPSTIRGYIRGELLRIVRLTTTIADRRASAVLLEGRLLRRGFTARGLAAIFGSVALTQRQPRAAANGAADPHHMINVVVPWYPSPTTRTLRSAAYQLNSGIWAASSLRVRIALSRSPNVLDLASCSNISAEQLALLPDEHRAAPPAPP